MAAELDEGDVLDALKWNYPLGLSVGRVPWGIAVGLPHVLVGGDCVGVYVVPDPDAPGMARVEDDGCAVPDLIGCGRLDPGDAVAVAGLSRLVEAHGVRLDAGTWGLAAAGLRKSQLKSGILRLAAALIAIDGLDRARS